MSSGSRKNLELLAAAVAGGTVVALAMVLLLLSGVLPDRDSGGAAGPGQIAPLVRGDSTGDGNQVNQIYRERSGGVGFITARSGAPEAASGPLGGGGEATGSGFVIDREGFMVTNNHVIEGASSITVGLGDREYEATLAGADPSTDIALLKLDAPADVLEPLPLGDSEAVEVGDPVVAIGNPFGLEKTVTTGIVSAVQREITAADSYAIPDVIQTDAAINPGNSGGPLLDSDGEVIGVNSQIATGGGSGGNVGIGFAVAAGTVKDVVEQIRETGEVRHPWLGISGADVDASDSAGLGLGPDREGVLVEQVVPDGPADEAGLLAGGGRSGDLIVEFDRVERPDMAEIARLVSEREPGDRIDVVVLRDGREVELVVELGERP